MGIDHVELMLEGHNCFPPMAPPRGQHYERWYHAHGGEALTEAVPHGAAAADRCRADVELRVAGRIPQLDVDRRPHDRLPARASRPAVLRVGVVSRSAPPVRRARAVVLSASPRRRRPAGAPHARPRAPAVVASRRARGEAADGQRDAAQVPRGGFAHAGAERRAAAAPDRELLRHDLADRPSGRPDPAGASGPGSATATRSLCTQPITATGSATTG